MHEDICGWCGKERPHTQENKEKGETTQSSRESTMWKRGNMHKSCRKRARREPTHIRIKTNAQEFARMARERTHIDRFSCTQGST